jgi:hypothetical protein
VLFRSIKEKYEAYVELRREKRAENRKKVLAEKIEQKIIEWGNSYEGKPENLDAYIKKRFDSLEAAIARRKQYYELNREKLLARSNEVYRQKKLKQNENKQL